ncbi:hypothetical protein RHSIM_Rhsim04G0082400 [Rhododendron simsii]|uniref:Cytochrome b561 domain-containing protein n=1 Tax=Rhododendron simsii TaxID=118357 RepID=A0A834LRM7_RHOSS|nr:hypothetical protein RHSIM_Rhsim04G0082400 [Rhododendron simsii]
MQPVRIESILFFLLFLLHLVNSYQEQENADNSHSTNNHTIHKSTFVLQTLSVLLATAGAIISAIYFDNTFNNTHQRMGLALYGAIWLQACIGCLRPHRGSRVRSVWFFVHWALGTSVSAFGIINVYTGLQGYKERTSKSVRVWTIMFTAEITLIAFLYLFQDKWHYIQKQGVILGNEPVSPTDQEIAPRDRPKEIR